MDYSEKSKEELIIEIEKLSNQLNEIKNNPEIIKSNISVNSFVNTDEEFGKIYAQVLNSLPIPAYLVNSKGSFIACNLPFQDFIDKEKDAIIGANPSEIFPAEIGERTIYYNRAEQVQVEFTSFDIINIKKRDEIRTVIVSETVYKNLDNEPLGILGIFNDITEKTKAEDKLRESEQKTRELNDIKDQFFHIVSHDLKSPFSALLGFSQLLVDEYDELDNEEKKEFIGRVHSTASFSFKMLTNLQLWSKLSLNKMPIEKEIINPIEVLNSEIEKQKNQIKEKNIAITINTVSKANLFVDKSMLELIYENLISNAVKFSGNDSNIEINIRDEEKDVIIEIEDHGIGLSLEDQAKLFKIEIHTVKIGQKKTKGTGLGLVLCKLMAEKNEGSISVMSKLEKGTRVKLKFPKYLD